MHNLLRFRTILGLSLATIIFIVGWGLYIVGSHKTKPNAVSKPTKQAADRIKFTT